MKNVNANKKSYVDYRKLTVSTVKKNYLNLFIGLIVFTGFLMFSINTIANSNLLASKKSSVKQDIKQNTSEKTYTVKPGDDFSKISEKMYGTSKHAEDIAQANTIKDPNIIHEGQKLIIPKVSLKPNGQISSISTKKVSHTTDTYTVKKGDFLWKIAEECYGDGNMINTIIKANNLTNIENIEVGKVLKIPRN